MKIVRAVAAIVFLIGCSGFGTTASAQEDDVLAEDVVAFLVAIRDVAALKRSATAHLDFRFIEGLGIKTQLYKVGPGSYIAPFKDVNGHFGFSIRRVDRCTFEERYTLAGETPPQAAVLPRTSGNQGNNAPFASNRAYEDEGNAPDRVYNFSNASFEIKPGQLNTWELRVAGKNVICFASFCAPSTGFTDITVTPSDADREQKAKDLKRLVALFQKKFCPGAAR